MKLSDILGWPENKSISDNSTKVPLFNMEFLALGHNECLTSCDREIDREALANVLYKICIMTESHSNRKVDYFISTMPTWLRKVSEKGGSNGK